MEVTLGWLLLRADLRLNIAKSPDWRIAARSVRGMRFLSVLRRTCVALSLQTACSGTIAGLSASTYEWKKSELPMKRYYIVTHGQAQHHIDNLVGGWFDSRLTPKGIEQAQALARFFSAQGFAKSPAIYSSDLLRCKETATIVADALGLEPSLDARLREMSFGSHEGMDQALHDSIMKPCAEKPGERMDHAICDGAETRRQFARRIYDFVATLDAEVECAIIVTHGFAASFLISALQRVPVESMAFISFKMSAGGVSELIEDDLFKNVTLTKLNMQV
ncbi:histidine phosphatase family protein [Pseudomonas sp. 2(2015)]|uniref:histidine phosphatase family protein n=1 Tax=Pseudomonas sp. 2(2015) TaxID=1619950 RepID=UPI0009E5BFF4|nr:histidine phosphatase family protein [Pseudomonas sp. 2(2015)]